MRCRDVLAEMDEARRAARHLGVAVVERGLDNEWRAAIPWRGSRDATTADRRLPLHLAARQLPAPTGRAADQARRLRAAEAEATINPLDRRDTGHPFWLGLGARG